MTKKIMVVDDEPDILFSVGQMLEMCGYEVIKAATCKECLSKLGDSLSCIPGNSGQLYAKTINKK